MTEIGFLTHCDFIDEFEHVEFSKCEFSIVGDTDNVVHFNINAPPKQGGGEYFSTVFHEAYCVDLAVLDEKQGLFKTKYKFGMFVNLCSDRAEDTVEDWYDENMNRHFSFVFDSWDEAHKTRQILFDVQAEVHERINAFLVDKILKECKASGKLDIKGFALENIKLFRVMNSNSDLSVYKTVEIIENVITSMIDDNELTGIINKKTNEYIDRQLIAAEQKVVNVNVQMDFSPLLQSLGNKGITVTSIECPKCGSPASVPEEGSMFSCEACGSTIKVTDVYEMFKAFLD